MLFLAGFSNFGAKIGKKNSIFAIFSKMIDFPQKIDAKNEFLVPFTIQKCLLCYSYSNI